MTEREKSDLDKSEAATTDAPPIKKFKPALDFSKSGTVKNKKIKLMNFIYTDLHQLKLFVLTLKSVLFHMATFLRKNVQIFKDD